MHINKVLIKISGEALMGNKNFGHDNNVLQSIAHDIKKIIENDVQVCVVVGGGNICRGKNLSLIGVERTSADYMGMLSTVINSLALKGVLEKNNISTSIQSSIAMIDICEHYTIRSAIRNMHEKKVVIFAAGIGRPFFTTDSAAVLHAIEMQCDVMLKATTVDGVYNADPHKNKTAKRYTNITYDDVLKNNLNVMDMTAIALARENNMPIKIFSIKQKGNIVKAVQGTGEFTLISK